jgi:YD repeat-containing protein
VYRNDLVREERYPPGFTGDNRVSYQYNRLGEVIQKTDQHDTEHNFKYDGLGRLIEQSVNITDTSAVDGRVLRIGTTYNLQGLPQKLTSYSSTSDASAIDQVLREYNDFGMLVREYQAHLGTQTGSTPYVEYTHDRTLEGEEEIQEFVKGLRPLNIFYPDRTADAPTTPINTTTTIRARWTSG